MDALERSVIRELVDKESMVVSEEGWQLFFTYFAKAGFIGTAREETQMVDALIVDLETLERDLRGA